MSASHIRRHWLFAVISAWAAALGSYAVPALGAAPLINATLEPRHIAVGESAQLTITSSGAGLDAVTLPVVSGLEFRVVGQSRRVEIIHGATLATSSVIVRVTPQVAGIFTIPALTPQSQPLVLRVTPDTGGAGSPYSGGTFGAPRRPPVLPGGSTVNGVRLTADGAAYLRMNLPKRPVYVGESIPVDIEVGLRGGFVTSLNGLPTLTGTDFTLNNLSRKPDRVEKLVDGQPFIILTWHSVLAPVKPGRFPLSVQSPLTIRVRTRPQRDTSIDDLLGDPFLQNVFGATVQKDVTVSSPTEELNVLALPTEGQPPGFSGAVGSFKIATVLSASAAAVGDPLTLKMKVSGLGNFDRVDSPMLERLDLWKTYPPKSSFNASDATGYKGEKVFEQPLIASQPGTQTLPALTFSYFDPSARRYETAHSAPLAVNIAPALADRAAAPDGADAVPPAGVAAGTDGWLPDHGVTDRRASSLVPLYLRPRFLALPSLLALTLAGGWLAAQRRAVGRGGRRKRNLSKAAARVLERMAGAAHAGDAAAFFDAARSGIRDHFAARWGPPATAMAEADLDARAIAHSPEIGQLFARADEAHYAKHDAGTAEFAHWTRVVRDQLAVEVPA